MKIEKTLKGTDLTIALEGRLDTVTSPELEAELAHTMDSAQTLTLDLAELEYISSAGLRVLLGAHKEMSAKGGLRLIHVSEIVREVLEITGLTDILTIE